MKAVIVHTCNQWKEYTSFSLVGVFTNRKKLNSLLNRMIKNNDIGDDDEPKKVNHLTIEQIQVAISYVSVQEITLNEEC
jgi:hypothetical protein